MDSEIIKNGDAQETGTTELSKDERKVYDRQIRLWGYDGQNKYVLATRFLNLVSFMSYVT